MRFECPFARHHSSFPRSPRISKVLDVSIRKAPPSICLPPTDPSFRPIHHHHYHHHFCGATTSCKLSKKFLDQPSSCCSFATMMNAPIPSLSVRNQRNLWKSLVLLVVGGAVSVASAFTPTRHATRGKRVHQRSRVSLPAIRRQSFGGFGGFAMTTWFRCFVYSIMAVQHLRE